MQKIRGLKPRHNPGKKRKASLDLSTNPHMEKCRKRVENMTDLEKRLEWYKNNDRQARTVALKKLWDMSIYKQATESEKVGMEEHAKMAVMKQR